jgi:hypothetical protein
MKNCDPIYLHLETDHELLERASLRAGHPAFRHCCAYTWGRDTTDDIADGHGCVRRVVEVAQ